MTPPDIISPMNYPPDITSLMYYYYYILASSSSESSLNGAVELLSYVARQGEESGFGMPCLLVAAKNDLDSSAISNKDSAKVIDAFWPCLPCF